MKYLFLIVFTVVVTQKNAVAGVMLEPYAGTLLNSEGTNNKCSSNCSDEISGNVFGLKVAFKQLGFSAGLDYQMTAGTTQNEASGSTEFDLTGSEYGIHFGYDFPIMLRLYATYWLNSEYTSKSGSTESTLKGASGYTLGVGYSILPMVALNLEMKTLNYSELEVDVSGVTTSFDDRDYDVNIMALKVSFPISI